MTGNAGTRSNRKSHESENLSDRVQARVADAAFALERRATASRPRSRGQRAPAATAPGDGRRNREEVRAEQSLRQVFRDLGHSYRRFRKQTGAPLTPGLRDAAYNFRAEPSLVTLVAVAAFLDELDLLS